MGILLILERVDMAIVRKQAQEIIKAKKRRLAILKEVVPGVLFCTLMGYLTFCGYSVSSVGGFPFALFMVWGAVSTTKRCMNIFWYGKPDF